MNNVISGISEVTQSTPPEIPPDFPISPPEPAELPKVSVPMVYVDSRERLEYRVKEYEMLEAAHFEADLNALGREGWWLVHSFMQEKKLLVVFSRRTSD